MPLILGAREEGGALPNPKDPDVRLEEAAIEEAVEAFSLELTSVDAGDGGGGGQSARIRLMAMRGLISRNAVAVDWEVPISCFPLNRAVASSLAGSKKEKIFSIVDLVVESTRL